jgi:hypothetical protein
MNVAVFYRSIPQNNNFDLEIFCLRPMQNITHVNFHKTEERVLTKMENNLKIEIIFVRMS